MLKWILLCHAVTVLLPGAPYLQVIGPPPLRFAAPRLPTETAQLPLLPSPPVQSEVRPATAQPQPPPVKPAAPPPTAGAAPQIPLPSEPVPVLEPVQPEPPAVLPQTFLKYFTGRASNAPPAAVIAPLGFTPPIMTAPPSSKASYSVTP